METSNAFKLFEQTSMETDGRNTSDYVCTPNDLSLREQLLEFVMQRHGPMWYAIAFLKFCPNKVSSHFLSFRSNMLCLSTVNTPFFFKQFLDNFI